MLQIRHGVFETNSSSTHSITMCTRAEFEAWKNGELLFNDWNDKFVEASELVKNFANEAKENYESNKDVFQKEWNDLSEEAKKQWIDKYIDKYGCYEGHRTYEEYMDDYYLETFVDSYTTEHGDTIVAFGKYGYDG